MKKKIVFIAGFIFVIVSYMSIGPAVKYPSVQDYVAGSENIKGDVDVDAIESEDPAFEIGANEKGYAVFKNPHKAFRKLRFKYIRGITEIALENHLAPLNPRNYSRYSTAGWQVTGGSEEVQDEACFVTTLLDIYENSF